MSSIEDARKALYELGLEVRREVLGSDYVDESLARTAGTESQDLQELVTQNVWSAIWTRPGLERRTRSLLNIAMLTAMNQHHELSVHVRGGIRNGLSNQEIVEAILQATVYCGAPSGLAAMRIAQEVMNKESAAAKR